MQAPPSSVRLLIVDDDLLVRTIAAEALRASGFDVSEADNGTDGLSQIERCNPDLVLLDVMMPRMDGYEVCRALRARADLAHIPVIMLTGLDDNASIASAYEAGATDFIPKPLNAALLAYRVRYALRAARMLVEIDRHRASLANAQRIARLGSWTWQAAGENYECSAEYLRVIGEREPRPDQQWRDVLRYVHPDDAERLAQAMKSAAVAGQAYTMFYRVLSADGSVRTLYEQTEVFRGDAGEILQVEGTTQDVSDRVAAEQRIQQLADYDGLTGMANRKLFDEVMRHGLSRCKRNAVSGAVLDINLDRFRRINETLGHEMGDRVLKEIAGRIGDSIRASDLSGAIRMGPQAGIPARMSGDSFAVFLPEIRRAEDAAQVARRLSEAIARPMAHDGHDLLLTATIGIAVYPENGEDSGTLLKNAEAALHSAKESGAGSFCFFTPEMTTRSLVKLGTENELRVAIERDELLLFYQPRVDVPSGRIVGAEALVRWQHPKRGLVPPGEFIPVAEESGLIAPLTQWVLRAACRQLGHWSQAGLPVVPISINFSAHSFRDDGLPELIAASLQEFGIPASLIEGEVTESMLMQDVSRAVVQLRELRTLGVDLAMDDFGTGYSSLAYLKRFPLDALKIDRAFVKDVLTNSHDAAIASTIITLARTMGMAVVAEGMEHVAQANLLLERGCRLMQGFLFARPMPASAFAEVLRSGLPMPAGLCTDGYEHDATARSALHSQGIGRRLIALDQPSK